MIRGIRAIGHFKCCFNALDQRSYSQTGRDASAESRWSSTSIRQRSKASITASAISPPPPESRAAFPRPSLRRVSVRSRRASTFHSDPLTQRFAAAGKMCLGFLVARARTRIVQRLLDFLPEPLVVRLLVRRPSGRQATFLDDSRTHKLGNLRNAPTHTCGISQANPR
jgi:hypothetical protein